MAAPTFTLRRSLLFSTLIVLVFFAAVEGALRIAGVRPTARPRLLLRSIDADIDLPFMRPDPELFWSPRPGYRGEFMGRPVTINAIGLRGDDLAPRRPGSRRLLCLGDSITFGYGVGDEEAYPHLLDRALAAEGVEVVNAGVTGYTSHQVRKLAGRLDAVARADIALVCVGWNDGTRRPVDDRDYERRLKAIMAVEGMADRLYLYRALKGFYVRSLIRQVQDAPRSTPRVPLPQYRENLAALVSECRARRIQPVFVGLPHRRQAGDAPIDSSYPRALEASARELNVPLLDPGELGPGGAAVNEGYFIDSLHLSPRGHQLLAGELLRQLRALGIV